MKLKVELDIHHINNQSEFEHTLSYDHLIRELVFSREMTQCDRIEMYKWITVEMVNMKAKWLYVGLKWLIFIHQCLNLISQNELSALQATTILGFLNKIQSPKSFTKHEEYLCKKVFTPYLQYLIKLASIIEIKYQSQHQTQNYIFLQLNLLRFTIAEFTLPISEFNRYFKQCYPILSKCFLLISRQVYKIYKRVEINYEMKQLEQMHFLEVDQLSESLLFFPNENEKCLKSNSTLATSGAQKQKDSPILLKKITNFPDMQNTSVLLNS